MKVGELEEMLLEYSKDSQFFICPNMEVEDEEGNVEFMANPGIAVLEEGELYFLGEVEVLEEVDDEIYDGDDDEEEND